MSKQSRPELVLIERADLAPAQQPSSAAEFIRAAEAPATRKAHTQDWQQFRRWCDVHGVAALPAAEQTAADYLAELARGWCDLPGCAGRVTAADTKGAQGMKPATLSRKLASISAAHRLIGAPSPGQSAAVAKLLEGVRKSKGTAQRQAAPLLVETLARLVASCDSRTHKGKRDRALLLLGHAGALRRSELVALDAEAVKITPTGLLLTIARSKTDQHGRGERVAIARDGGPLCPTAALEDWLLSAGIQSGPIFRAIDKRDRVLTDRIVTRKGAELTISARLTPQSVTLILKNACEAADVAPRGYSAHSLRAGLVTEAYRHGRRDVEIAQHGRWRSSAMLARYRREAELLRFAVTSGLYAVQQPAPVEQSPAPRPAARQLRLYGLRRRREAG